MSELAPRPPYTASRKQRIWFMIIGFFGSVFLIGIGAANFLEPFSVWWLLGGFLAIRGFKLAKEVKADFDELIEERENEHRKA